jgi:hypothetical protein
MDSLMDSLMGWAEQLAASQVWVEPLTALCAAFVFGQLLAWTYEFTFHGLSYSRGFSHTIVLVCLSATTLVLAMQHSLLAGLGLFGVLSMIRFRSDLRTPRDLVFVMGAACVGVASGVGAILSACLGAVAFSVATLYLQLGPFGSRIRFDGVLRFRVPATVETERKLHRLLNRHCRRQVLLSLGEVGDGAAREHTYQVKFFRKRDREALLMGLRDDFRAEDAQLLLQDATTEY